MEVWAGSVLNHNFSEAEKLFPFDFCAAKVDFPVGKKEESQNLKILALHCSLLAT
jgi:hypothetical protein